MSFSAGVGLQFTVESEPRSTKLASKELPWAGFEPER